MEDLKALYQDPKTGLTGKKTFIENLPQKYSKSKVSDYLKSENAYTLYKPIKKKFKRDKFYSSDINDIWMADLMDMQKYARWNNNKKYILIVVDAFSRKVFARALDNKNSFSIIDALNNIFKQNKGICRLLYTDRGKEFMQKPLKDLLDKMGIKHTYSRDASIKASMAERFIGTLRERIGRLFEVRNKRVWIDALILASLE
jgi:transposase InsO family protein